MKEPLSAKDAARADAFAEEEDLTVTVIHKGREYIVKPPTAQTIKDVREAAKKPVKQDGRILRDGNNRVVKELDEMEGSVRMVIACTFIRNERGALEQVFDERDVASLMAKPVAHGSLIHKLKEAADKLQSAPDLEELRGK